MRLLLMLLFTLPVAALADEFDCSDLATDHTVAETLGLEKAEPLWATHGIAVDPLLAPLSSKHTQKVNVILYPHQAAIDWIFQTDIGDINNYPEYKDELEQNRIDDPKMLEDIAQNLFNGNVEAMKDHFEKSKASTVQQWEFERKHMLSYVNGAGAPSVQRDQVSRHSQSAWVVYDVALNEAVKFAQFVKARQPVWLDHVQIFAMGAFMTDCETGHCSIKRD